MRWPDGYRAAAVLAFDLDGPTGTAMVNGTIWNSPKRFAEGSYGAFRSIPRLLSLLAQTETKATFFTPAWVVEKWPETCIAIAEAGHEIAHHGYLHERFADLSAEAQHDVINRSQESFRRILGWEATGYRAPTGDWSPETTTLLSELGFNYSSSMRDGHEPYLHVLNGVRSELVEIPARVDLDDYAYFAYSRDPDYPSGGDRIASYRVVQDNFIREIDGHRAVGGCFITTFHPQLTATPGRARIIAAMLEHLQSTGDTWVTTADAVATHAREALQLELVR